MILALLWLTISLPFVFSARQQLSKNQSTAEYSSVFPQGSEEDSSNPLNSTTEEKAPTVSTFSEEYLHDNHHDYHYYSVILRLHKCEDASTYNAYHGELHVPPPNAA